MQLDMHYYGTYAMARAAGLKPDPARIIATSAQFVDDNVAEKALEFKDSSRIDIEATAHHTLTTANLNPSDQRHVWVPFHFLPGNIGESYRDKIKCRKNSEPARKMIEHHLSFSDRKFSCELIGIGAHVYADTFSHYGFSGISSRGNFIDHSSFVFDENLSPEMRSYIDKKKVEFLKEEKNAFKIENIKSMLKGVLAESFSGALGHGAVATFPDRPYLKWSFRYEADDAEAEDHRLSNRNNLATFLEGCKSLHKVFEKFAQANEKYNARDGKEFSGIENTVKEILAVQAPKEDRINAWKEAANTGKIFGSEKGERIPDYDGDTWNKEWASFDEHENCNQATQSHVWQFYRAAAIHRTYVLRDLLPSYGLVVD